MGRLEFYDDEEIDGIEESEPTFSFYDFKKWLETQNGPDLPTLHESIEIKNKDALKEEFKKNVCDRVQNKINKKLNRPK